MTDIDTSKLTVGQEVVVVSSGTGWYGPHYSFGWKVHKVTPSGQVVMRLGPSATLKEPLEKRFDKHGREMNSGSRWYRDWLDADVEGRRADVVRQQRVGAAKAALGKVRVDVCETPSKEKLEEYVGQLEAALAEARAKVAAV
jgi:hypothetical protein